MSLYDPREYPTPRETVEVPSLDVRVSGDAFGPRSRRSGRAMLRCLAAFGASVGYRKGGVA